MVRTVQIASPCGPHSPPYKDRDEDQEENPCHFKPENAADTAKRTQKADHSATQASARSSDGFASRSCMAGIRFRCGVNLLCRVGLRIAAHALAGDTSGHAQPNPQHSSDGLRSHSDMMVSATIGEKLRPTFWICQLPLARRGSKVIQSHAAPCAQVALAAALEEIRDIPPARTHSTTRRGNP